MTSDTSASSVGVVTAEKILIETPLTLACGVVLPSHELMVETYGTLNADKSNALLICHALSGSSTLPAFMPTTTNPAGGTPTLAPASPWTPIAFLLFH